MGCLPSKKRDEENTSGDTSSTAQRVDPNRKDASKKHEKSVLAPTIQMVNEDTLKLLKELGELKVFQTANNADHKRNIDLHQDIILALENPTKGSNAVTSLSSATESNMKWTEFRIHAEGQTLRNIHKMEKFIQTRYRNRLVVVE